MWIMSPPIWPSALLYSHCQCCLYSGEVHVYDMKYKVNKWNSISKQAQKGSYFLVRYECVHLELNFHLEIYLGLEKEKEKKRNTWFILRSAFWLNNDNLIIQAPSNLLFFKILTLWNIPSSQYLGEKRLKNKMKIWKVKIKF